MSALRLRISVEIDGRAYEGHVEPRTPLSDFIRHGAGLTGTKVGCEQGGACTFSSTVSRCDHA